jgi:hypothetical protein
VVPKICLGAQIDEQLNSMQFALRSRGMFIVNHAAPGPRPDKTIRAGHDVVSVRITTAGRTSESSST